MAIKMKHTSLEHQENTSSMGCFFLYLYTASCLLRLHEFSENTSDLILIKIFAILAFIATLFSKSLRGSPALYMLMGLLPLIMISAFWNGWATKGIDQSQKLIVSAIIPFWLFSSLLTTIKRQKQIMVICIIAALFMVFNGYLQQTNYDPIAKYGLGIGNSQSVAGEKMRITYFGFFQDPNDLGIMLIMSIPLVAFFYSITGTFYKLICLIIFTMLGYGIYMTGSRGTLLGVIGVVGFYYLITKGGTKLILFTLIVAPFAATVISSMGGMTSADASAAGRLYAWYDGILMLLHNPIFGIGLGNFREVHGIVAHNSYISVAAELGIPGYSLWAGAIIFNMFIGYKILKFYSISEVNEKNEINYELVLVNKAIFFSMVGFMITAFFLSRQLTLLLFIFLGFQTASNLAIAKLQPEIKSLFTTKNIILSMASSWLIIIAVYMTLQVAL